MAGPRPACENRPMRTPLLALAALAALVATTATASAQAYGPAPAEPRARTFGLEAAVALPTEDGIDLWLGGLARIHVPTSAQLTITGRLGVMYALHDADGFSFMAFPLYGGVAYSLSPEGGLYLAGEAGLTILRASVEFAGETESDTETELGLTLGAGYKKGNIDFRGALWFPTIDDGDSLSIMASVGFDISTF